MFWYVKTDTDHKNKRLFLCAVCGAYIAGSSDLIRIEGAQSHSHVNPAGVRCNFFTVSKCDNVFAGEELYEEHSWFNGYGWRFMTCSKCMSHLGWVYDALSDEKHPSSFAGLLINSVVTEPVVTD